jgi:hypothetical protein
MLKNFSFALQVPVFIAHCDKNKFYIGKAGKGGDAVKEYIGRIGGNTSC